MARVVYLISLWRDPSLAQALLGVLETFVNFDVPRVHRKTLYGMCGPL